MMTPDRGFLSRSHVPGSNPQNETKGLPRSACALMPVPDTRFGTTSADDPMEAGSSLGGRNDLLQVTRLNHRTPKSLEAAPKSMPPNLPSRAWAQKLGAVQKLAGDILFRIEKLLHDDPAAVVDKNSAMLPREIEDSQAYFLQKIQHACNTIWELGDLLQLASERLDSRELVSTELIMLFVLVASYRPERILELGWKADDETQRVIREKIESLSLDVINMRERLK